VPPLERAYFTSVVEDWGGSTLQREAALMIDVKTADRELQLYIRPQTFPVAIRMLRPGEEIPEKARRPARDFKKSA